MAAKIARAVIVGGTSALGKELAEQLNANTSTLWELTLAASAEEAGQVTSAGDEAVVVVPLTADTFAGADIVFFAGDAASTQNFWQAAQAAGASLIDLTGSLPAEANAVLGLPGVPPRDAAALIATVATIPHAASWMLHTLLAQMPAGTQASATVMVPASAFGTAAMDELHQQTVSLLSFQTVPTEFFGAQAAFTVRDSFGPAAKADLARETTLVRRDLQALGVTNVALQLVQVPVFHGVSASVFVTPSESLSLEDLQRRLESPSIDLVNAGDEVNSQAAAGQGRILVHARAEQGSDRGFWLWAAADNLYATAQLAAARATELLALRASTSTIQ